MSVLIKDIVKERPIIFSADMVSAILRDDKTQTRRIIKPMPFDYSTFNGGIMSWHPSKKPKVCQYGVKGGLLWVREKWRVSEGDGEYGYAADSIGHPTYKWKPSIHMRRQASRISLLIEDVRAERIQSISRVDAFKEGINEDWLIFREGNELHNQRRNLIYERYGKPCAYTRTADNRACFAYYWDLLNSGRRDCSWADNPWVWVIEFKRIN